ncbi:MAG: thioredoxin [Gammaproteobacteria bacterium]|jgi:putative thioredoxin
MNQATWSFETTTADFDAQVLEQSRESLVIVDFWAEWCAPCRVLMPLLQKLADDYQGKLLLAKVNADKEQELAARWGIRSLPTVKFFRNGTVVDEFLGAQPESAIRAMIEQFLPRESDTLRATAQAALRDGEVDRALELLRKALALDPEQLPTKLDLADALLHAGQPEEAQQILELLPLHQREEEAVKAVAAKIELARTQRSAPSVAELSDRVSANPDDLASRHLLGAAYAAKGDYAAALEQFLEIMKRDRRFDSDIGRRSLLNVFKLLGDDHELVQQYRRKMAPLLY